MKSSECIIYVAKAKALISCMVIAQLIFAYAKSRFSHGTTQITSHCDVDVMSTDLDYAMVFNENVSNRN